MTCVWEPDEFTLEQGGWEDIDDDDITERALLLATSSLIALTLGRVGACPVTIRPCPQDDRRCLCAWNPHLGSDGLWYNDCFHRAPCAPLSEIDLEGPVGYISSFLIDGQEVDLDGDDWRLDNGHLLVWQGEGPSPVPSFQDLNKPDSAVGTFSITFSKSYPVLLDGRIAVAALALEFAKAFKPKSKCSLPRGVTNIVRSGVSFTIEAGLFPSGLTGIDVVDQFILKWVPPGAPLRSAQVFDPTRLNQPRRTNAVPRKAV